MAFEIFIFDLCLTVFGVLYSGTSVIKGFKVLFTDFNLLDMGTAYRPYFVNAVWGVLLTALAVMAMKGNSKAWTVASPFIGIAMGISYFVYSLLSCSDVSSRVLYIFVAIGLCGFAVYWIIKYYKSQEEW